MKNVYKSVFSTRFLAVGVLLAFWLIGLTAQAELRKIRVEHYQQPGTEQNQALCLVVQDATGTRLLSMPIAGFSFQWGITSHLTVDVTKVTLPGVGEKPTEKYQLVSVDEQTKVASGTGFSIFLSDANQLQGGSLGGVRPYKGASKEVDEALRERLNQFRNGADRQKLILFFRHPENPNQPLVLENFVDANTQGLE